MCQWLKLVLCLVKESRNTYSSCIPYGIYTPHLVPVQLFRMGNEWEIGGFSIPRSTIGNKYSHQYGCQKVKNTLVYFSNFHPCHWPTSFDLSVSVLPSLIISPPISSISDQWFDDNDEDDCGVNGRRLISDWSLHLHLGTKMTMKRELSHDWWGLPVHCSCVRWHPFVWPTTTVALQIEPGEGLQQRSSPPVRNSPTKTFDGPRWWTLASYPTRGSSD